MAVKLKIGETMMSFLIDATGLHGRVLAIEGIQDDVVTFNESIEPINRFDLRIDEIGLVFKVLILEPYPHYEFGVVSRIKDMQTKVKDLIDEFESINKNTIQLLNNQINCVKK